MYTYPGKKLNYICVKLSLKIKSKIAGTAFEPMKTVVIIILL